MSTERAVWAMRPAAGLVALVVVAGALSGCTGQDKGLQVLLKESVEVGLDLYGWGDDYYSDKGQEMNKRSIKTPPIDVPADIATLGIRFAGKLVWDNATLNLTLTDSNGNRAAFMQAKMGARDSTGEISGFFEFQETYPAHPGAWKIVVAGWGKIGQVSFQLWGIEQRVTAVERYFDVTDTKDEIKIRAILNGWGETPTLSLTYPNGTTRPLALDQFGDQAIHTFDPPDKGRYTLRADTADWGGRVAFIVEQNA